jgi:hypothetical protein
VTILKQEMEREMEREMGRGAMAPSLEDVAEEAARQFGVVLGRPMSRLDGMAALRAAMECPAQDTPLRIPAEVERLRGVRERPTRA